MVSSFTELLGVISLSGVLDIEGLVQGILLAEPWKEALVRVVDKGRVEGEIRAPSVVINGIVEGNVYSTRHLELASKARVQGNVFYTLVELAAGAEVNGALAHVAEPDNANAGQKDPDAVGTGPGDNPAGLAVVSAKLD